MKTLIIVVMIMSLGMACHKKEDIKPASSLSMKVNDTSWSVSNLSIDYTHLVATNSDYIQITCSNFKLTIPKQSGSVTPYIAYIVVNGKVYDYEDYNKTYGMTTDSITGTVNSTVSGDNASGSFDLYITHNGTTVHIVGTYSK